MISIMDDVNKNKRKPILCMYIVNNTLFEKCILLAPNKHNFSLNDSVVK